MTEEQMAKDLYEAILAAEDPAWPNEIGRLGTRYEVVLDGGFDLLEIAKILKEKWGLA